MKGLELEQRIRARIREFDVPALLSLLAQEGYAENDIEYRSHRTLVRQGHLVHDIQFIHVPRRRVVLTVNIGLLSVQSPLPAFFLQHMEGMDPLEAERMERFLGYFDHELLRTRFGGLNPERDERLLPGWEDAAPDRLSLLNISSPSTLHWLFSQAFPEAEVRVRREVRVQAVATRGARMSATALGVSDALGGFASVPTGSIEVELFFGEMQCGTGAPWNTEAPNRLALRMGTLLPTLNVPLSVWMVLREQSLPAQLRQDSYLGYSPLARKTQAPQRLLLFQSRRAPHDSRARQADSRP